MRPRRTTGVPVLPGCPARFSVINLILGFWVWQPAATQGTDSFAALTPVSWHDPDWQTVRLLLSRRHVLAHEKHGRVGRGKCASFSKSTIMSDGNMVENILIWLNCN